MVCGVDVEPDLARRFTGKMDHAQSVCYEVAFAYRFVNHQRRELGHLIRACHEVCAIARLKYLGVPEVIAICKDDFSDPLQGVEIRPIGLFGRRWIDKHCGQLRKYTSAESPVKSRS